jgi:hypothetical protein
MAEPTKENVEPNLTSRQHSAKKGTMRIQTKQKETHTVSIFDQTRPDIMRGMHSFGLHKFAIVTSN